MTYQILKSRISALGYDFAAEVDKHIAALEAHRFTGDAAPHSYPEVEAAIERKQYPVEDKKPDDFVADYEIVNDDPPAPTFAERKQAALAELRKQEQVERDALFPPETRRLADRAYRLALAKDPKSSEDTKVIADRQALDKHLDAIDEKYAAKEAALVDMQ